MQERLYKQQDSDVPGRDRNPWLLGAVVAVVGLCLLGACLVSGYLILQPVLAQPTLPPPPPLLTTTTPAGETPPPPTGTAPVAPTVTLPGSSNPVSAIRLPSPPSLDGSLAEWTDAPTTTSSFRVYNAESWDGTADLTAVWRLAWDANNLYVAVDVTDDVHVQTQTGNQIFRGDSVEIQIDTNPEANATSVNPNTYQIVLSPGDFAGLAPSAFRFRGNNAGEIPDAPGHAITVAARQKDNGYTLEAAIPWRDLAVSPVLGQRLGLALNANDNDTPGTATQEVMMSNVSTRTLRDPRTWGTLTLE